VREHPYSVKILEDYLRKQPSIAGVRRSSRFYATHLEYPGRVKFLRTPSKGGTETGLVKRASHIAPTSLGKATIASNSAPFHATSAADGGAAR